MIKIMKSTKAKEVKEVKKEKFDLQEAFVLWKNTSKGGKEYYKGFDLNKNVIVAFKNENKKNEKEADYRVYYLDSEGKREDVSAVGLWKSTSKAGNDYLSGLTNENEKIIAYFGDESDEKRPYIKAYFKKD